jgi:hypothetical protein
MNDLETRLRALPLRTPSTNLDSRVWAHRPEPSFRPPLLLRRGIPLWLAAAAGLLLAIAGYAAGRFACSPQIAGPPLRPAPVMVQVVYNSPDAGDPFDFTRASKSFPAGELEAKVQVQGGI